MVVNILFIYKYSIMLGYVRVDYIEIGTILRGSKCLNAVRSP